MVMVTHSQPRLTELKAIGEAATLPLDRLVPSKANRNAKDEDLAGLASSIAAVGLLYPLIVRPHPEQPGSFLIVAGERRFRALKRLKAESAPCIIVGEDGEAPDPDILRVVENHQRRNLEPLEEAAAIRALLDAGQDIETVARSLGRSRAWIARRSSLTGLSEHWVREIKNPASKLALWPPAHLELIARFPPEVQDRMLERWGNAWHWNNPSLADIKTATGGYLRLLASAPWKTDDETLCPEAGACAVCPKRSSHAPELFPEELPRNGKASADDHCLDPACWDRKADAFLKRRIETLRREHPGLILLNAGEYGDRSPLAERLGGEVINAWDVACGKKSDAGAIPGLIVNGAGLGRLKWVLPAANGTEKPRGNGRDTNGNGASERTPEDKKVPYDKRRRQVVIDAVKARLETLAAADDRSQVPEAEGGSALAGHGLLARTLCLLTALLADYGWRDSVQRGAFDLPQQPEWGELAKLKNHELGGGEMRDSLLDLVWHLLRLALGRWASRLLVTTVERDNARQYAEAEIVCALLGYDLTQLRAQAAQAIPYAKCWRNEVEDAWGTPPGAGQPAAGQASLLPATE